MGESVRRKPGYVTAVCVMLLGASALGGAPAQNRVVLSVAERAGTARTDELVVSGLPIPRSWAVKDVGTLRLTNASGTSIPAQFEALARWGAAAGQTTAPVRWALVQFKASVPSSGTVTFLLDRNGPGPAPPNALQITRPLPGRIQVNTGAAVFVLNTASFNLIEQVTIAGQLLLNPLPAKEALVYRPAGTLGLVRGTTLPDLTPRPTTVTVERQGPLIAILRARGSLLNAGNQAVLDYTARLHFAAGRSDVRVDFTVENNHPIIEDIEGQPANGRDQRTTNSVYIGSLQLRLRLASTGGALHALAERGTDVTNPATSLTVYQDSSGTDRWNAYVGLVGWPPDLALAHPRLQSYCAFRGYRIQGGGIAPLTGNQSEGWIAAYRTGVNGPTLSVAGRGFWQNFPKMLAVEPGGIVTVDLFPRGEQFFHNFRVGEQKTHTLLLSFSRGGITGQEASRRARAFNHSLFATAPASWYVDSGALGDVIVETVPKWSLYERFCRTAFEPNPDFNPTIHDPNFGNRTLLEIISHYSFYGWQDYGDFPLDYEAFGANQAGQLNIKYWYLYGLLIHFCRSADSRWLDLALPAARHLADIDFLHIPDEGVGHWAHGGYFGHCYHDEPGNWNPNRNYGGPTLNLFYGVPDLILAYHLTGERRFLDVALEGLIGIENLIPFSEAPGGDLYTGLGRDVVNFLFAYLEGYRQTGDSRLLAKIRQVLARTANFTDKGWVTNPAAYGKTHPGEYLRTFMFLQELWGLGRYLDFLQEYGLPDDQNVKNALAAYADFLIYFPKEEYAPGRAAVWYDYYFDGIQWNTGDRNYNYRDINNWALVAADALAYAWKYSGRSRYLNEAAKFYRTGMIDPVWLDDPPVYQATKDLVNSLNWGLVYMRYGIEPRTAARSSWSLY